MSFISQGVKEAKAHFTAAGPLSDHDILITTAMTGTGAQTKHGRLHKSVMTQDWSAESTKHYSQLMEAVAKADLTGSQFLHLNMEVQVPLTTTVSRIERKKEQQRMG